MTGPVAQVGCGYWGRNLVRNYAQIGALGAVVDPHGETADRLAQEHAVPVRSWADVLADPAIGGVSLATPAESHAALASQALAAGKHVFVEKPLALSVAECRTMIADAQAAGRVLMVGHLLQYHPIFLAMHRLIASGEIGALAYIYSNRLSLGKFRTEEDVLWSFAPHDISMILALAGAPASEVRARGTDFVTPGLADAATVEMGFDGGLRAHCFVSWAHPFKEQRLVAIGTEGMAVFEDSQPDWARKLAIYRHVIDTQGAVPVPTKADPDYIDVPHGEPLRAECEAFVAAIRTGQQPRTDGAEGLAVIDVLERATAGMATR